MTPEQCKEEIKNEYYALLKRVWLGEINYSCIYGIIESRSRDAARHNGVPEYWREYMPEEISDSNNT